MIFLNNALLLTFSHRPPLATTLPPLNFQAQWSDDMALCTGSDWGGGPHLEHVGLGTNLVHVELDPGWWVQSCMQGQHTRCGLQNDPTLLI